MSSVIIYDENNFPSGYAGGKVLEKNPDFALFRRIKQLFPFMATFL